MRYLQEMYFSNFNAVCNLGGHYIAEPGTEWSIYMHAFSQCKFYLVADGSCDITIDGKHFVGKRGDWFLIPGGAKHCYKNHNDKKFELFWMHFDLYPGVDPFFYEELVRCVRVPEESVVWGAFEKFSKISKSESLIDCITIKSILLELIAEYFRLADQNSISVVGEDDTRIDEILKYINSHLSEKLTVTHTAEVFHMHPNHFIRFFKTKTGQTPAKYIKARRMETVKRYLEQTELSVKEIMNAVGECDPYSFSKQFKSAYSFSPANYRKYFKKNNK